MTIDGIDVVTRIEVKAVLSFLQEGVQYETRVARIMRTISEALHFGRYCGSTKGKSINLRVSRKASCLIAKCTKKEFGAKTVLEHPLPLEKIYLDLVAQGQTKKLNSEAVVASLKRYDLITITKEEDLILKHNGWATPVERYANAKIEVGRVGSIMFGVEPSWTSEPLSDLLV